MSREEAMEQYIALLSDRVPGWMEASSAVSFLLLTKHIVLLVTYAMENATSIFLDVSFSAGR